MNIVAQNRPTGAPAGEQRRVVGPGRAVDPPNLAPRVQWWFLQFLLLILALAVILIVSTPTRDGARAAAALGGIVTLAALSLYRHYRLPDWVVCDVGAAALILVIGWGMPDHLTHVFGLAFVHLFLRAFDVATARVIVNGVLHPLAYFCMLGLTHGLEALVQMNTITNLVGFVFVAGLMHTLATSLAQQQRLHGQIAHQATHDPLTGLPNRSLLTDRLSQALARTRRHDARMALVFIDLDGFKQVNDRHGHRIGDQLLAQWGQRLHACLRGSDTAARLGGDEFAVIIEDVDTPDQARVAIERIRAKMHEPYIVGEHTFRLSASCGIALSTPTSTPDDLIHHADTAMYAEKASPTPRIGPSTRPTPAHHP